MSDKNRALDINEIIASFHDFGLSEREARIYTTLLEHGEMSATEIHKITGFPQTKIYALLSRMVVRGLCLERLEGRKRFFLPVNPTLLLETLRHQWEEELDRKYGVAQSTLTNLEKHYKKGSKGNLLDFVEVIHNKSQIHRRYISLVANTQKDILAFNRKPVAAITKKMMNEQIKVQQEAIDRGVVLKGIIMSEDLHRVDRKLSDDDLLRVSDYLPVKMFIFDHSTVLMAMPTSTSEDSNDFTMMVVRDKSFAEVCEVTFNHYWNEAYEVEKFK